MNQFSYREGTLHAETISCRQLSAEFGTPLYVYSRQALESAWRAFDTALSGRPHLLCYGVKANSNIAVLNVLAQLGSGFDIVSVGELERVLVAGRAIFQRFFPLVTSSPAAKESLSFSTWRIRVPSTTTGDDAMPTLLLALG